MEPQYATKVYASGSLRFVSKTGKAPRRGACFGTKQTTWEGEDVIGAVVSEKGSSPKVHVYHCPKNVKDGKSVRHLKKAGPFYTADMQQAKQFAEEVRNANNRHGDLQIGAPRPPDRSTKTVLAVVNPQSGKGKGVQIWSAAQELLEAAGVRCESIVTTHPGHAIEETAGLDLAVFACIIVVGGDGSIHEVLQYGLLSDLDVGTEHLRKVLGGERFTYGAIREVIKWKKHKANIAFFKEPAAEIDFGSKQPGFLECPRLAELEGKAVFGDLATWPDGWTVQRRDSIRYLNLAGPQWAALDANLNPWGDTSDGLWEFAWDKAQGRGQALQMILATQAGKHDKSPLFEMERVSAFVIEPVDKTTFLTVDGEKVELERLSIEVHRKLVHFVHAC